MMEGDGREPWIESRAGGLFFVNALLATPAAIVAVSLLTGWIFRLAGLIDGPSRVFDTIPIVAAYFLPRLGWLALPAAWVAWRGLRVTDRPVARACTGVFLAVHLAVVVVTVSAWLGIS